MGRVPTHHGDEREGEERKDQDHLAAREPEFELAVRSDGQDIDDTIRGFSMRPQRGLHKGPEVLSSPQDLGAVRGMNLTHSKGSHQRRYPPLDPAP